MNIAFVVSSSGANSQEDEDAVVAGLKHLGFAERDDKRGFDIPKKWIK